MSARKLLAAFGLMLMTASAASQKPPAIVTGPVSLPASTGEMDRPPTTPQLTTADVGAWLDGFMPASLRAGKIAGAQVVVVKDGHVLFKKGYGLADVARKTPMNPDLTLMRIGSTSKLFTWTAVMQLVEAGKIDLNADVNRYLDFHIPSKPGRIITMNDLMTHRAGFEEGLKDLLATDPAKLETTERYLKGHIRPLLFPSGTAPAYSNYGAALAGYIVQRVSGEPFASYVQRHILSPLQMHRTTFLQPLPRQLAPFLSKGYRQSNASPAPFELVETAPAGSVSTTGADMANFMIAQLQDGRFDTARILNPETAQIMHSPTVAPRPGFDTIAHGFFYGHRNGKLLIGHGGDTIVFHTDLNLLPQQGVGIFVSFNSRGENDAVYGVRSRLLDLFMDRYFPAAAPVTPVAVADAAKHAQALAGRYESSRRVEHGFISLFYLIQQESISANQDGTISLGSYADHTFREIAPNLWREVDGTRQLAVTTVEGRRAIVDSTNPVQVLQAAPFARNASLFQIVAGGSLLVLIATLLLWPVSLWLRRSWNLPRHLSGRPALIRRLTRFGVAADLLYLAGWYVILAPILQSRVDAYNDGLDGMIRALQIAAIVPVAAAALGVWNCWLAFRLKSGWGERVRAVIVAAALLGVAWIAWMGGLMSWTLNY